MAIVTPLRPHPHPSVRDPERTRERILGAALKEFSAHGFAGARVDRIARRARINKRMLYHYFGNKEGLFRAILRRKLGERLAWAAATPGDPGESLVFWFDVTCADLDPRQTLLGMMDLTMFPVAFPQITRLATGLRPKDPAFRKQRIEFLRRFAGALLPERARPAARRSAGTGARS